VILLPNGLSVHSLNRNETEYLYKEIFEEEAYVPPRGLSLPDAAVVFDVGANVGLFTLFAARRWPRAQIFAFEPVPEVCEVLRRNVGHLPRVSVHEVAVGEAAEVRELTYYANYTMMSGFTADPGVDKALASACLARVASTVDPALREAFV